MISKLHNSMANVYYGIEDVKRDPMTLVKKLERGDADSSGSTLRTVGIIVLVLSVILVIGAAVLLSANGAANSINQASFESLNQR